MKRRYHHHTHTHLGGPSQCESSSQHFIEGLRELGGGLCLVFGSALGSGHDFTACHVEGSSTGTEVALEGLVAGSVSTGILERREGREREGWDEQGDSVGEEDERGKDREDR